MASRWSLPANFKPPATEADLDALATSNVPIVLSVVGEGMPLLYSGQEAGNPKRLKFFERDPIAWKPHPIGDLYAKLFALKKRTTALWNGAWGATMIHVPNSVPKQVLSFVRRDGRSKVFAAINFSDQPQTVRFEQALYHGAYTDFFADRPATLDEGTTLELAPWDYRVFVQQAAED